MAEENGVVWVLNGSGRQGQASDVAAYLEYLGRHGERTRTSCPTCAA